VAEKQKEPEAKLCDAQNATTHPENTHKHSDFQKGRIIKLAFELRILVKQMRN